MSWHYQREPPRTAYAGAYLIGSEASKFEQALTIADPFEAAAWDRRAQARWDAYAQSPYCAAVDQLFARPN